MVNYRQLGSPDPTSCIFVDSITQSKSVANLKLINYTDLSKFQARIAQSSIISLQ